MQSVYAQKPLLVTRPASKSLFAFLGLFKVGPPYVDRYMSKPDGQCLQVACLRRQSEMFLAVEQVR